MASGGSTFEERFAYARWLYHAREGEPPSQTELAKRVGRKQPSVGEWYTREKPPADWEVHAPLCDYLGVTSAWLIRDAEPAPEVDLWAWWIEQRRHQLARRRPPSIGGVELRRSGASKGEKPHARSPQKKDRRTGT